jgi:hypothetical protein
MANPRPEDELRPGADKQQPGKNWRDRFPGWETYERKPNDPRFASKIDPNQDLRFNTNLNPSSVVRRRLGPVVVVLGVTLGILLLVLLGFLMFRHFQTPSPRTPQPSQSGRLIAPPTARMEDSIADNALPLRKEHHVHRMPEPGMITAETNPAQSTSRRAVKQ